jgi:transketolase
VMQAADALEKEGISVEVINNHTIKPLDTKTLLQSVKKTKAVVTVEDHQKAAGMGSSICELCSQEYPVPILCMGMDDSFGESGSPDELYSKYGLDEAHIITAVHAVMKKK